MVRRETTTELRRGRPRRWRSVGIAALATSTALTSTVLTSTVLTSTVLTSIALGSIALGSTAAAAEEELPASGVASEEPAIDAELLQAHEIYQWAAATSDCSVPWTVLAGIGAFASDHGRIGGTSALDADGVARPHVFGPTLDGSGGIDRIDDTDGGALDGNDEVDRAVGPFQFLPATWEDWASDGNGDGIADPHNAWDAATAAAKLLCAEGPVDGWARGIDAYFGGDLFTDEILQRAGRTSRLLPSRTAPIEQQTIGYAPPLPAALAAEFSVAEAAPSADSEPVLEGDWNGDGTVTGSRVEIVEETHVVTLLDAEGRPYGRRIDVPVGAEVFAGDWNGNGIDTLAVVEDLRSPAPVVLDRLGRPDEDVVIEIEPGRGRLISMAVPAPERAFRLANISDAADGDVQYVGPAVAHDGTALELWRVRGITVDERIAADLLALLTDAEADGVPLSGWGYRSHEQQIVLRRAHCADVWESPASSCRPPTARPGTSRHEFGVAVDFTQDGSILTRFSSGYTWMKQNAADYGFINLPSEPWHWSIDGG